jgi:hypothetical protein
LILFNLLGAHGLNREIEAIVRNCEHAEFSKHGEAVFGRWISMPEEIEVPCRAVGRVGPNLKEHGALQNELVAIPGLAQTIEEPLQRVARENQPEILALSRGDVQELPSDRGGDIAGFAGLQTRASM